jgi:hypothetical protein
MFRLQISRGWALQKFGRGFGLRAKLSVRLFGASGARSILRLGSREVLDR